MLIGFACVWPIVTARANHDYAKTAHNPCRYFHTVSARNESLAYATDVLAAYKEQKGTKLSGRFGVELKIFTIR